MAGRIQNEDLKSLTDITGAGGIASQLPNDTKIYVTANSINKQLSQAIIDGDIGGTSGGTGKNYMPFGGRFTSGITGWSAFNTTFTNGVPTTITAGSTKVTLSQETTNPLSPAGSLKFDVTTIASSAGHGAITDAMTIEDIDLASVFQFIAFYKTTSGSTGMDMSGTSSQTLELWVYNVGLASWYQPTGFRGMNSKDISASVSGEFQTDSSNASSKNQYRFAIIIKNAPTSTCTVIFDNMYFGRNSKVYGAAISDWSNYTPTFANLGSGSVTSATGRFRRVGDSYEIQIEAAKDATAGTGASTVTATLPTNAVIDSNKLDFTTTGSSNVGTFLQADTALTGVTLVNTSTTVSFYIPAGHFQGSNWSANAQISAHFTVPIVGFASNTQFSQDTDTRVVSLRIERSATATSLFTAGVVKQTYDVAPAIDTHGGWDSGNNRYIIPVKGVYSIFGSVLVSAVAAAHISNLRIRRNGNDITQDTTAKESATSINFEYRSTTIFNCNAGDFIELFFDNQSGSTLNSLGTGTAQVNRLFITRLSGPSAIAASETVAARYTSSAGQLIEAAGGGEVIDFGTKDYDTHNAVTTGAAWKFTAPVSGVYIYAASFQFADASWTTGDAIALNVRKNGTSISEWFKEVEASGTIIVGGNLAHEIYLLAGDTLDVFIDISSGANKTFTTNSRSIQFTISKRGI